MNKIETAINIMKMHIKQLESDRVVILTELAVLKKQLEMLESIEKNKSIPHELKEKELV